MLGALLMSLMIFVTDMDNTLVHYDMDDSMDIAENYIMLPASSGSGRVASVSQVTIETLDDIRKEGVEIICATGMRASTMFQREKYFPSVSYFACENGGRIFQRASEGFNAPIEITSYVDTLLQNTQSKLDLDSFSELLRTEGCEVDNNYLTMVRIKGKNLEAVVERIPKTLGHTFNLGHLDIQLPGCGKLSAVRWILKHCLGKDVSLTESVLGTH
jgi:hydroxymethylpyrimidine pyrophosphatase-like HAD family hydrolase